MRDKLEAWQAFLAHERVGAAKSVEPGSVPARGDGSHAHRGIDFPHLPESKRGSGM